MVFRGGYCAVHVGGPRASTLIFAPDITRQAGPETIHQMLPNAASTDATYDAGQYPIYYPELAAGDGKDDVENNCELCHSPRYITMQPPLPAQAWADEVNKMRKTFGAIDPR